MELGASGLGPRGLWLGASSPPLLRVSPYPGDPFGLASGARGWVAGGTGCLGVLPPWGVIAVAAPGPPRGTQPPFCDLGVKYS